jgi:hypothetical protein
MSAPNTSYQSTNIKLGITVDKRFSFLLKKFQININKVHNIGPCYNMNSKLAQ